MFSGGVDSTLAAVILAREYDRVHLLTYSNGYGHVFMNKTRDRVDELRRKFGNKFEYRLTSSKDLFEQITVNNVANEVIEHKSGFVWCMGCKLGMHTKSIIYNLEKGVPEMADGSSRDTSEMVEQKPFSLALIRSVYRRFNIAFHTPVYNIPRKEEIRRLREMKFNMGFRIMDRFIGIQPKCMAGEIYYLPNILFRNPPKHDNSEVLRFFRRKINIIEKYIKNYFKEKKMDLGALKQALADKSGQKYRENDGEVAAMNIA